jgi:hypothetical protein
MILRIATIVLVLGLAGCGDDDGGGDGGDGDGAIDGGDGTGTIDGGGDGAINGGGDGDADGGSRDPDAASGAIDASLDPDGGAPDAGDVGLPASWTLQLQARANFGVNPGGAFNMPPDHFPSSPAVQVNDAGLIAFPVPITPSGQRTIWLGQDGADPWPTPRPSMPSWAT